MKVSSLLLMFLTAVSLPVYAFDLSSPAGLWMITNVMTGKPGSLIRIECIDGEYQGWVEKIFPDPNEDPNPRCVQCEGARKNQPILGLNLLWGLTQHGDEYNGGEILNPRSGKTYRVRLKLEDGGQKLDVRGFIGVSLLGYSIVWTRVE
jgi:hypothetical protein